MIECYIVIFTEGFEYCYDFVTLQRELEGPQRELGGPPRELRGPPRELGGLQMEYLCRILCMLACICACIHTLSLSLSLTRMRAHGLTN